MEKGGLNRIVGVSEPYGDGNTPMPEPHLKTIRELPEVVAAMGLDFGKGTYHDSKESIGLWAVDSTEVEKVFGGSMGFDQITETQFSDFVRQRTGALVGKAWTTKYGWKIGDMITIKSSFPGNPEFDLSLKITGIIPKGFF